MCIFNTIYSTGSKIYFDTAYDSRNEAKANITFASIDISHSAPSASWNRNFNATSNSTTIYIWAPSTVCNFNAYSNETSYDNCS